MRLSKFILFFCCMVLIPHLVQAENPDDKARVFFENKQYLEASALWNDMVNSGKVTPGLYYNIGLAQSNLGNIPQAMLAFEKALRLKPSGKSIRNAIQLEKEKMVNGIIPVKPFFLMEWSKVLLAFLRPGYWALLGLLILIFAVTLHFWGNLYFPKANRFLTGKANLTIFGFGILCLLFSILAYRILYREDEAILHASCEIRQAASDESSQLMMLSPGEKIIILDQLTGWYYVRLVNIEEGWIRKDCTTQIKMGTP